MVGFEVIDNTPWNLTLFFAGLSHLEFFKETRLVAFKLLFNGGKDSFISLKFDSGQAFFEFALGLVAVL